jgi:hypothetical protein
MDSMRPVRLSDVVEAIDQWSEERSAPTKI